MGLGILYHTFKGNSDMRNFLKIYGTLTYFSILEWMQKIFQLNIYYYEKYTSNDPMYQFSSVTQSCLTLCNPLNHSMPGLPVHHQLLVYNG